MNSPRKSTSSEGPHRTVVIKVGTSSLIRPAQNSLNLSSLAGIVGLVRELRQEGYRVVLVSSGAVGVGVQRLSLPCKPSVLAKKQALAAVGQVHLMRYYEEGKLYTRFEKVNYAGVSTNNYALDEVEEC
jgi:glutamate 5-kinase